MSQPMSDIFLSYASADRDRVRPLVAWLQGRGWSVWWDRTIVPGQTWDEVLAVALADSRCVLAVWSRASVNSDWVRIEASDGKEREILVPILIDDIALPLAFRLVQAASLVGWNGEENHPALTQVALGISAILNDTRPKESALIRPAPAAHIEPRVLDAAICRHLPVHEPADLIAMVRREASGGLRAILEFDEEYAMSPSDVASKPFELEFPLDPAGKPLGAELLLRIKAPDFEPPSQEKKLRVPPGRDSVVCAFLLTPQVQGNLLVQLEVLQGESSVASRLLRPTGIPSDRPVARRAGMVVSMPLPVSVHDLDRTAVPYGPPPAGSRPIEREKPVGSAPEQRRPAAPAPRHPESGESDDTVSFPRRRPRSHSYMRLGTIAAALFVCVTATYLFYLPRAAPPGMVRPTPPDAAPVIPPVTTPPSTPAKPMRVEADVQASKLVRRVAPAYPEAARRSRAHGEVVLSIHVDQAGNVSEVSVLSGHPLLRDAAVEAVRRWKYSPTLLKGEPVPVTTTVTVTLEPHD